MRISSGGWPKVTEVRTLPFAPYPIVIAVSGGVYARYTNGEYTAKGVYNDRPVYKNGQWSIYYRVSGFAANNWVLDFNDVSEEWDGTVAYNKELL